MVLALRERGTRISPLDLESLAFSGAGNTDTEGSNGKQKEVRRGRGRGGQKTFWGYTEVTWGEERESSQAIRNDRPVPEDVRDVS